jgi:DNA topoisomerase-3
MTGHWERRLNEIERGRERLDSFMTDIKTYVREVVGGVTPDRALRAEHPSAPEPPHEAYAPPPEFDAYSEPYDCVPPLQSEPMQAPREPIRPAPGEPLDALLRRAFGFDGFRPHQEAVCRAVTEGNDILLVMPTGAGKSLCYQLPGIARGGTTLVVSPLIALMEDQTAALRNSGFAAERIHSGMSREAAREVCRQYLRGILDFLFIAPERLGVPGFPEMLAKRMPVLVAVDEAHCISHWGHDFRPDYRMLKERLTLLRSAPVIAMTATATPIVQNDIIHQLGMPKDARFIHGFRRTNIALEVVEIPQKARGEETLKLLKDSARRPAIVYAPTRKKAEALAADLVPNFPTAAYHAGMNASIRDRVQTDFLSGRLEVIVATIAFGMGIDKPNVRTVVHVALPGSIESYYQEVGRAGRDGSSSCAVLMYAYADVKTHEFFLDRDYPEPAVLARVYERLTSKKQPQEKLLASVGLDEETLATVLEKLWIHGGADVSPNETVSRGENRWQQPYIEQRRHKEEQLALIVAYAQSMECRMLRLVRHFGDQEDSREPCGECDICQPSRTVTRSTRAASETEQRLMAELLGELQPASSQAKGKLFRDRFENRVSRNEFEALVEALFRAGLIRIEQDDFTKEGRVIEFQRLFITQEGYRTLRRGGFESRVQITVVKSPKRKTAGRRKKKPSPVRGKKRRTSSARRAPAVSEKTPSLRLVSELKAWRLALARQRGIPAFRILTDRVVNNIVADHPHTEDELLQISGVGQAILKKYGKRILAICRQIPE